eukprot:1053499-Heterocapsa_arctica.AAC.1
MRYHWALSSRGPRLAHPSPSGGSPALPPKVLLKVATATCRMSQAQTKPPPIFGAAREKRPMPQASSA